jgi:SAM-dependent methyltransferase
MSKSNKIQTRYNGIIPIKFKCNICGRMNIVFLHKLERETPSCSKCHSTVRMRAIIHTLSEALFGQSLSLKDFPVRPDLRVIGLSDWIGYANPLMHKLDYTNTYYHREPNLDIMAIAPKLEGTLDAIISSDVFEHVPPPVSLAFLNCKKMLKPSGVLILTVPYYDLATTNEHFPELYQYKVIEREGHTPMLKNTTREGSVQMFDNLVFHGGEGATLEMRVFSKTGLMEELERSGFGSVKFYSEPNWEFGIYWPNQFSLPLAAHLASPT